MKWKITLRPVLEGNCIQDEQLYYIDKPCSQLKGKQNYSSNRVFKEVEEM